MGRRKTALVSAAVGTAAGVAGLGVLALPAGAGPAPSLPPTSAEQLVQSVLTARPPAMNGTVEVRNALGLPALPGIPQAADGTTQARLWTDGQRQARLSLPDARGEKVYVQDGETRWQWDSATKTATRSVRAPGEEKPGGPADRDGPRATDPATAARELVGAVATTSTVAVDGTARVAGRPAYELVLTPKPTERTLLREVRVAIDAELRMPLELGVYANGSPDPAFQVGFTRLSVGPQDPALFRFTPPLGATVRENGERPGGRPGAAPPAPSGHPAPEGVGRPTVVGDGWDTVLVTRETPASGGGRPNGGQDQTALLQRIGKPVSGPWGSGWLITTKVGTALLTSDGRVAAGAVPPQVVTEAIGQAK